MNYILNKTQKVFNILSKLKETGENANDFKTASLVWEIIKDKGE